jgi:hypothetical protein
MGLCFWDRQGRGGATVTLALCISLPWLPVYSGEQAQPQPPSPAVAADPATAPAWASGRANYIEDLTRESLQWRLAPEIADAVAHIESGYLPTASAVWVRSA